VDARAHDPLDVAVQQQLLGPQEVEGRVRGGEGEGALDLRLGPGRVAVREEELPDGEAPLRLGVAGVRLGGGAEHVDEAVGRGGACAAAGGEGQAEQQGGEDARAHRLTSMVMRWRRRPSACSTHWRKEGYCAAVMRASRRTQEARASMTPTSLVSVSDTR